MASGGSMHTDQEEVFKFIKLEPLGAGAYGSVYVAKYGDTKCAAKIMHQALFQFTQDGKPSMSDRFEQECELLRTIRHPRIVQFLDKVIDPDTGLSVLLMELMDENLTNYLEKSSQPPHYHVQVNIFHDIASALSYLHSRGFIHRDVSGNNVLLVAGCCRAKLSDFGVSKSTFDKMDEMTICPGAPVYMAPECSFRTGYSNKIDVFSLGVVGVQMVTCKFPQPGPQHERVNSTMLRPVPETERRLNHIQLIPEEHCLKATFLECLDNNPAKRPSCGELCELLVQQKEGAVYLESIQSSNSQNNSLQATSLTCRMHELTVSNDRLLQEVQRLRKEAQTFSTEASAQQRLVSSLRNDLERLRRSQTSQAEPSSFFSPRTFLGGGLFRSREMEQRLRQTEQEKRQCLHERDTALEERDIALAELDEAKREVISIQDRIEWSQTRLEDSQQLHSQALRKYDDLQVESNRIRHLLRQANEQLEQKTTKLDALGNQLNRVQQESAGLREVIESRDDIVKNIQLELSAERRQASHRQSSAADQQSLQGISEYIRTTGSELSEHLKKQLSDKNKELEASQEKVVKLENQLRLLRQQLDISAKHDIERLSEGSEASETEIICNMCSDSTYKEMALTIDKCDHILCKSCLIEVLNESRDALACPVIDQYLTCLSPISKEDIRSVLDPEEFEALYNQQNSFNKASNAVSFNVLGAQQIPNYKVGEQTDSCEGVISKNPRGRHDLCPLESFPDNVEVKSKIHDDSGAAKLSSGDGNHWSSSKTKTANPSASALPDSDFEYGRFARETSSSEGYGRSVSYQERERQPKVPNSHVTRSLPASAQYGHSQLPSIASDKQPPISSLSGQHLPSQQSQAFKFDSSHRSSSPHPPPMSNVPQTSYPPHLSHSSQMSHPPLTSNLPQTSRPLPTSNLPQTSHPSHMSHVPSQMPHPSHMSHVPSQMPHPSQMSHPPSTSNPLQTSHPSHMPHHPDFSTHNYQPPPTQPPPTQPYHPVYPPQHPYAYNSYCAHRPPHAMVSWPPEAHHYYRPRTAPIFLQEHPHYYGNSPYGLPPTPEYEYAHGDPYHPLQGSGRLSRAYTSPHLIHQDQHAYGGGHPHAYTEGSGPGYSSSIDSQRTSHPYPEGSDSPPQFHVNRQHSSSFQPFQTNTTSLISSLSSSGGENEYLAVLMQQRHVESPNHSWKVVFTVCMRTPCCVEPLQELLKEQFGAQFEVASFCIKFKNAVILNIPYEYIKTQGYTVHTAISPCKIALNEVVPGSLEFRSKATPTYPPRHTLTVQPIAGKREELLVSLTLEGIETCSNQRQFCLKSPPLLVNPSRMATPPTYCPPARKPPSAPPFKDLLQKEADTNSVTRLLGDQLIQSSKIVEFGQALGVKYNELKELHRQAHSQSHPNPAYNFFCDVVERWRTQHSDKPTWEVIVHALKNIGESKLVCTVEKYLRDI